MMLTIELEQSAEAELLRRATLEGKPPGEYAAKLLLLSLTSEQQAESALESASAQSGLLKDEGGNVTGLDGLSWRELAHEGHRL